MALDQPAWVVENLAATLTLDEQERAARFHFERDKRRFTVARGLLRQVLARLLDIGEPAVRLAYGAYGKPYLPADTGRLGLEFSLSHSEDWALAGFAQGRSIGVDMEKVRAMPDLQDIARANFAPAEVDALIKLPANEQLDGFFACWSRKEAYVKSLGLGMSLDLSTFVVSVKPNEDAEFIPEHQEFRPHHIRSIRPRPGFWAAVALEAADVKAAPPTMHLSMLVAPEKD